MCYSETEFRFRSKIFVLFGISTQGGSTWKNSKSFLKTQQGIYVAGNIIFDSTSNRRTPPVLRCQKGEFRFRSTLFWGGGVRRLVVESKTIFPATYIPCWVFKKLLEFFQVDPPCVEMPKRAKILLRNRNSVSEYPILGWGGPAVGR